MRKILDIGFFLVLTGLAGYYVWLLNVQAHPCDQVITYRIGVLDPRFGVSTSTFMADIVSAASIWDKASGKALFAYDPNGEMPINLIYDNRQQTTDEEHQIKTDISSNKQVADFVKAAYTSLTTQYDQALTSYQTALAQFKTASNSYSQSVAYWNNNGGAPPKEYDALAAQKSQLTVEQTALKAQQDNVNKLADQINALIDKYNLVVDHINTDVKQYNNNGLVGSEFEEGEYVRDGAKQHIDIYQFDNQTAFVRVIAHELGHALGLGHNSNPNSIMNPVNSSTNLAPTADDLAELDRVCNIK